MVKGLMAFVAQEACDKVGGTVSRARTFRSVFVEEHNPVVGGIRWRIKGSGVQTHPTDAALTAEIKRCLVSSGVPVREYSSGSAANADSYHLEADFEDGGLYASTGNYWFGERGAWIKGRKAVEWVARKLELTRMPEERS